MREGIALCWIKRGSSLIVIRRRKALPPLDSFDRGFSVKANNGRVLDLHVRRAAQIGAAACRVMSGYGMQTRLLHLHEAEPLTQSASSYQV
jgi:hypothetical protein